MPGQGTAPTPQTNCRGTADRINPLHTNPPDYTGAHRNTHVSTRPVVLFPAINTSEHRAGHVKQAHRFRWACFTLSYSPWSGSTGQGIKNPRAVFVVWGTQLGYNDGVHSVPHTCTPSLYSTGDVKICTASFRLNARTSRHMGVCFGWTPPQNPKGQRRPHRRALRATVWRGKPPTETGTWACLFLAGAEIFGGSPQPVSIRWGECSRVRSVHVFVAALFLSQREMNQGEKSALFGPSGGQNG